MTEYDFSAFGNVTITGADLNAMSAQELSVLHRQAQYCQAMTEADIDTMREIVSADMTFTHMSGRRQSREEYFADVADDRLNYFTIGIEDPRVRVAGDTATITFTSVLNANAYGARGTFRIVGSHHYRRRGEEWIAVNAD
ncbi:nuclear transport factor 2 family protein [Actinomyces ruminicola]|uniref:nuclear transport factor 2 family protein n=1 Tax=Actinomyces ruminicola TaxID=332524 RepID=UPI0016507C3F|nr:nuclear transport factor 2 family protein [Actinomyces ruminicola]